MRKILEHIKESYINKDTKGYRGIVSFGRNVTKRGEMWTLKEGSKDFRVHNHMTQYSPNNQKGCSGSHIKKKKKKRKRKRKRFRVHMDMGIVGPIYYNAPRQKQQIRHVLLSFPRSLH